MATYNFGPGQFEKYDAAEKRKRSSPKILVTSDLQNHGTTSLDVMKAKAEIFGFLTVKIILAQTITHIIIIITKGD